MYTIPIYKPEFFEFVCCDLLNDFIATFTEENGCIELGFDGLQFSKKGERLYNRYIERLRKIGQQLFPEAQLDIKASFLDDLIDEGPEYEDGFPITTFFG